MSGDIEVGPAADLPPGEVTGAGNYAVGNADGELFAVTRRCRHLFADLAGGTVDEVPAQQRHRASRRPLGLAGAPGGAGDVQVRPCVVGKLA